MWPSHKGTMSYDRLVLAAMGGAVLRAIESYRRKDRLFEDRLEARAYIGAMSSVSVLMKR